MPPRPANWPANAFRQWRRACSKASANKGVTGQRAQAVLDFWFGPDPLAPQNLPERLQLWFGSDDPPEIVAGRDALITGRFGALMEAAALGELDRWSGSPHRLLALTLLLDQFPRHAWRGRALAYSRDQKALGLVLDGLQTGADAGLSPVERLFLYLPLQHAESPEIQEESVAAYRRLHVDSPVEQRSFFARALDSAEQHRRVVQRFGRFPHRNDSLDRHSTAEELEYLRDSGGIPEKKTPQR
jgi:uncharacterized protein (DUF924 family)